MGRVGSRVPTSSFFWFGVFSEPPKMSMSAKSSSGFFKQGNTSENNEKWWVIGENHELSKDPLFKVFILDYSPVSLGIP